MLILLSFGIATKALISVRYALRPKKNIVCNLFSVLYEDRSVAEETVEHHPLSVVKLPHDISRL